jgi:hypothetical protein
LLNILKASAAEVDPKMVRASHRVGASIERRARSGVEALEGAAAFLLRFRAGGTWESHMISETQIHTIARQMIEKHGFEAIAQAARNAVACEGKGDTEEAREWRHIEDAMKIMRGPHHS